jgi:acyl-CoA synthetase (AMP-forming)/AMP-acid ligase II
MTTLIDILKQRATETPDKIAFESLDNNEKLSYHELWMRSRYVRSIIDKTTRPNETAILLFMSPIAFIVAFWGTIASHSAAAPLQPPHSRRMFKRMFSLIRDTSCRVIVTEKELYRRMKPIFWWLRFIMFKKVIVLNHTIHCKRKKDRSPHPSSKDIAFIQFTSGSTGQSKGVIVGHDGLYKNTQTVASIVAQCDIDQEAHAVASWLPLYHDMGLISAVTMPVYMGCPSYLMSPLTFLKHPHRWLEALSKTKATVSASPNFGYELCIKRVSDKHCHDLDLSHWKIALNGAERIRANTLENFLKKFEPYGLSRGALFPSYGMAENTVFITGPKPGQGPKYFYADALELSQGRVKKSQETSNQVIIVSCGHAWNGDEVVIVDPASKQKQEKLKLGEIWLRGPALCHGYRVQNQVDRQQFDHEVPEVGGGFFRTGDQGFQYEGDLYITGRLKDIIIIRGKNYIPDYLEQVTEESSPAVRKGCVVAFSTNIKDEEKLIIIMEYKDQKNISYQIAAAKATEAINAETSIQPYSIVVVEAGRIQKTGSGKVRRSYMKKIYKENNLKGVLYVFPKNK